MLACAQCRFELVTGRSQPDKAELEDFKGEGADQGEKPGSMGVPYFWVTALCTQDGLSSYITDRYALCNQPAFVCVCVCVCVCVRTRAQVCVCMCMCVTLRRWECCIVQRAVHDEHRLNE
jgi:hypothetical protein